MVSKGTAKPYVQFLGNSSTDVTGSTHHIRFKKYSMLFDCGLIQGYDIATDYRLNRDQLKKIKPNQIDYIFLSHVHIDHSGMIPALYAKGCQAHIYIPQGSIPFLKLLWEDSMKIFQADCLKLQKKHGIKAAPYYTEVEIERALNRCVEVPYGEKYVVAKDIKLTFYPAGHIINASQIYLELQDGYVTKKIGFTGDIGGPTPRPYVINRETLPFCNLLIGESTYNAKGRINNVKDREMDLEKIAVTTNSNHKILIPAFSLQRTQELLLVLYELWKDGRIPKNIPVYLDSPLAQRFCSIWDESFDEILRWPNLYFVREYPESVQLQMSKEHCIILSASGFLNGGRVVGHLKTILPDPNNTILFVGYSGENNLASQIKSKQQEVVIEGEAFKNQANIYDLRSFSSHANREELIEYYGDICRFEKLCLVHGQFEGKVEFAHELQDNMVNQGKSSRVVAVNQDTKIYI